MMVGGGSALNLSLLSRGVGEITKNGHEKIDVVFEPQDYYNFVNDSSRVYLPPIQPSYAYDEPTYSFSRASKKSVQEISMPKTFTTRKGALLLFSEDMAHRTRQTHHHVRKSHMTMDDRESHLSKSADEIDLRTVDDLAKSILSFGAQDSEREDGMYLKFVHGRRKRDYFDRQIRPGFSAKRYLSSWTKCWDDTVLEKVISKGYLTEKSLFYYNPLMPHLQRRLNDDMSHYPTPYKLMRSMLMSPGSLSGYTFYRIRPESAETCVTQDVDIYHGLPPSQGASIKVISTKDGVQREVTYGSLDKKAQEEVLTDLLVKSAVHYAMKKQQEYFEDNMIRAIETNKIREVSEGRGTPASMPQFDMQDAVESLLDTQRAKGAVIEPDLPEDRSSVRSGSLKPKQPYKKHGKERVRSTSSSPALEDKEYIGGVPVVSFRDGSGSPSSVPQLPHIPGAVPLTPIGETSREQTTVVPLPPIGKGIPSLNIQPPTPQNTTLDTHDATGKTRENLKSVSEVDTEEEWGAHVSTDRASVRGDVDAESKKDKGEVSSHAKGSNESVGTGVQSLKEGKLNRTHWKGSQTSVKSSKKGSGSIDDGSVKGSVIMGPEGEIINVGGTIKPHLRDIDMVHDANKVFGKDLMSDDSDADDQPEEWKKHRTLPPGARDQMKNFANKRATPSNLSVTESVPRHPHHGDFAKIDYTSGDIDATLSISSWSYAPRDQDPELNDLRKTSSLQSLPNLEDSARSKVSEKEIVDALADHAQQIASSVLSRSTSGKDLEDDVRRAAKLWMDTHPPRDISRSHSVQDKSIVQEIMAGQEKRKSAGPTAGEYKELIKENLKTAMSSASGENVPADTEVSPELIDTLAKEEVAAEDLEIVQDDDGKSLIRTKSQVSMAMGGVKEGHIYVPVAKNGQKGPATSIPVDRQSNADIGELAVIHYSGDKDLVKAESEKSPSERGSKTKSQPPSTLGESIVEEEQFPDDTSERKSHVSFKDEEEIEDEFQKAVKEAEQKSDKQSMKSGKTESDGKKSKVSVEKSTSPVKKKEEFVVGKVDTKDDIKALYGQPEAPPKEPSMGGKTKKKVPSPTKKPTAPKEVKPKAKGKGKAKKKEESPEPKPAEPEPVQPEPEPKPATPKPPTPPPPKEEPPSDPETDRESVSDLKSEESFEFHIVRDSPSPSPPPPKAPSIPSVEEEPETEEEEALEDEDASKQDEAARLRMISNREARAAKRAAQAEKRRQEVEKRRREREDQLRREKEEFERQQQLKAELEEERKRQEEQRRLKREQADAERDDEERKEEERLRRQKLEEEKERRRKEEYQRKLEEMKRRQAEEEKRRHEEMLRKQEEEEEQRRIEAEKMAAMEEEERRQYELQKKLEEEERLRKEEEERIRREEEAKRAMEEARRLAEEMARKQAEMEARLKFNRTLQVEARGLEHSQDITRAFVFSYFELLQWLGLDIPEFELLKLNQY